MSGILQRSTFIRAVVLVVLVFFTVEAAVIWDWWGLRWHLFDVAMWLGVGVWGACLVLALVNIDPEWERWSVLKIAGSALGCGLAVVGILFSLFAEYVVILHLFGSFCLLFSLPRVKEDRGEEEKDTSPPPIAA